MQEEMEALLNRRWIRKAEDKELYYKIRDQLGEIRKFATEKMGCPIVENTLLVKMEKVPVQPQPFISRQSAGRGSGLDQLYPAQEVDPGPPVCPGTGAAGCD